MAVTNQTDNRTLHDFNEELKNKLLVPTIYLYIILVVGLLGNSAIIIVYRHYNKNVYRKIIWTIGVVDLLFCLIAVPFNLARMYHPYTFMVEIACQLVAAILDTGIVVQTHLLLLLTIYRFRRICVPNGRQITMRNVSYFIAGCFFIGLCLGIPFLAVLQPLAETKLSTNVTGSTCSVAWKESPQAWKNYNVFLTCLFLFYTALILLLYALIGRTVYLQARRTKDLNVTENTGINSLSIKMTKIAFTVSAVFAVSYLPFFLNEVVVIKPDKDGNIVLFSFLNILMRSYLINHVANAFIYSIFDERFRYRVKGMALKVVGCGKLEAKQEESTSTETNDKSNISATTI